MPMQNEDHPYHLKKYIFVSVFVIITHFRIIIIELLNQYTNANTYLQSLQKNTYLQSQNCPTMLGHSSINIIIKTDKLSQIIKFD